MTVQSRRAGPWIHAMLAAHGVDTVFGIPGVHTIPLYDGLVESGLRHVTPRHEQGAGFMADGYARISGKPGVCFVITGPGVTNIVTAMAQADADSIPMLVISSVNDRRHLGHGRGQLHELPDQQGLMEKVAAFSHTLQSLADLPAVLARAFAVFEGSRPRPVHIEIPLDLWSEAAPDIAFRSPPVSCPVAGDEAIRAAATALGNARHPVILCGGGATGAADLLPALAERLDAPVIMTTNGRGVLPPGHPLALPVSPSLDAVRALLADSDAALAVGTELGPTDYDMYGAGMPALPQPLIRVEIDAVRMVTNAIPDIALPGDAAQSLRALAAELGDTSAIGRDGAARADRAVTRSLEALDDRLGAGLRFLEIMREVLPDAPIVGDSTHPVYAGNLGYGAPASKRWFNSATGFGTLGYALPAAIGAALAGGRQTICLIGDGGLHYTLGELGALKGAEADVVVVVWNNECYGEIRDAMVAQGVTPVGVALASPDFTALARAYDLDAVRVDTASGLKAALAAAGATGESHFIEIDGEAMLADLAQTVSR